MPANKGFKLFDGRAFAAMVKESKQPTGGVIPGKPVIEPCDPNTITIDNKKCALEAASLIKEK